MVKVEVIVTNQRDGFARITSFPYRPKRKKYEVPLYKVIVKDVQTNVEYTFKAIRFGVKRTSTKPAQVVGLQNDQEYILNWNYITTMKEMAWRVYRGFFIHRGPVNPLAGNFGSVGCVEICGLGEWKRFNTVIKQISGSKSEEEVGIEGLAKVIYQRATKPSLKLIP